MRNRARGPRAALLVGPSLLLLLAAACDSSGAGGDDPGPQSPTGGGIMAADDGTAPPAPLSAPHACGVRVRELAVFQAVKVPLVVEGQPVAALNAPIVEGRRAYFRAYVDFGQAAVVAGNARARLRLASSLGNWKVEVPGYIGQSSSDAQLDTTFNFDVPGDYMRSNVHVGVELELGGSCPDAGRVAYPRDGLLALPLQQTGAMKVTLVPVAYEADGSGRLPDLSDAQVSSYRDLLMAYYPVSDVLITVRQPVRSKIALTGSSGWGDLLDAIREQRELDRAPPDVHYYALVSPTATYRTYCGRACIAGLSYLAVTPSGARQVGAGIGYSGAEAGETLAHELGHQHGRGHAPCLAQDGLDKQFPYANAGLGAWGIDFRDMKMMSPTARKDLMSYCEPIWISDYTFGALAERRFAINATTRARVVGSGNVDVRSAFRGFRTLLSAGRGQAAWGRPLRGEAPEGTPEIAHALDAAGQVVAEVTVYRTSYGEGGGASYDVPAPAPGWASLRLLGHAPLPFAAVPAVPALEPM